MLDHARTVLLNARGAQHTDSLFVPTTTPALLRHRDALGPLDSRDLATRSRAFWCLAPALHSPALESWTLKFDPRITYLLDNLDAIPVARFLAATSDAVAVGATASLLAAASSYEPELVKLHSVDPYIGLGVRALAYVVLYEADRGRYAV